MPRKLEDRYKFNRWQLAFISLTSVSVSAATIYFCLTDQLQKRYEGDFMELAHDPDYVQQAVNCFAEPHDGEENFVTIARCLLETSQEELKNFIYLVSASGAGLGLGTAAVSSGLMSMWNYCRGAGTREELNHYERLDGADIERGRPPSPEAFRNKPR